MSLDWRTINHSKESRENAYFWLVEDVSRIDAFLNVVRDKTDTDYYRVMWALEILARKQINLLTPHLPQLLELAKTETKHEALRPFSKIFEAFVYAHYSAQSIGLSEPQKHILTELCFDWLITKQKAAVKAYAMTSLYYLGTDIDWVHKELERYLTDNYQLGVASFRARARQVLQLLNK